MNIDYKELRADIDIQEQKIEDIKKLISELDFNANRLISLLNEEDKKLKKLYLNLLYI